MEIVKLKLIPDLTYGTPFWITEQIIVICATSQTEPDYLDLTDSKNPPGTKSVLNIRAEIAQDIKNAKNLYIILI